MSSAGLCDGLQVMCWWSIMSPGEYLRIFGWVLWLGGSVDLLDLTGRPARRGGGSVGSVGRSGRLVGRGGRVGWSVASVGRVGRLRREDYRDGRMARTPRPT